MQPTYSPDFKRKLVQRALGPDQVPVSRLSNDTGVSLDSLGLRESALVREDALRAIEMAASAGVPILGGDVYVDKNGQFEPAYANWYAERREGEDETTFARRSCIEGEVYISMYPNPPDGVPVFVLVTGVNGAG